jgi:hypothetical protein
MRKALAWTLFYLGDRWDHYTYKCEWTHDYEWPYDVYNRLMCWSYDVQGDGDGPWEHYELPEE